MTCERVLALIDVGPFADVPQPRRDAAWAHAADCPTCGAALAASKAITDGLRGLPHPQAPGHMRTAVMARVAVVERSDDGRDRAREGGRTGERPPQADWSGLAPLVGTAVGLVIVLAVYARTGGLVRLWNSGWSPALPETGAAAVAVVSALGIFVLGLFAPLKGRRT